MLDIDIKAAEALIKKETGFSQTKAAVMAQQLLKVNPQLQFVVASWLSGVNINFEFQGVTMSYIMQKENCTFVQAIFTMSVLLNSPYCADVYKNADFSRM